MTRRLRIALPFALIAIGAVVFYLSPWPAIVHLALGGAHVRVAPTWRTYGLLAATLACWIAAVWLSLGIRPAGGD